MIPPARLLILAAVLTASLAACDRDPPAKKTSATSAAAPAETAAGSPLAYESKTPYAEVELTLPAAIKAYPALHAALYADEVRALRQFTEGAQGERTEAGFPPGMPPFAKDITITRSVETSGLLSLRRRDYDFSGGAHPNTLSSGILWDKTRGRRLTPADLFAKGADLTVLDQSLCSAINAAKRQRVPDSKILNLGGGDFACPRAGATPFVLAPGSAPGKAAGLVFLIDPYQVGPYVEGAYEIAVPAPLFRSLLAPEYADDFGGQLAKTGDITPL